MEELALLTREDELIRVPFASQFLQAPPLQARMKAHTRIRPRSSPGQNRKCRQFLGKLRRRQLRDVDEIPGDCEETERVGTYGTTERNIHDECVSPINVHPDRLAGNKQFSSRPASAARRVIGGSYKMVENGYPRLAWGFDSENVTVDAGR